MVDQARSDMLDMRRKLHHTQVALAASQTALTAAADTEAYLRAQLQQLEQLLGQQQQQDLLHQEQNKQQQLQELKQQQAEVLVSTPGTCKPQVRTRTKLLVDIPIVACTICVLVYGCKAK